MVLDTTIKSKQNTCVTCNHNSRTPQQQKQTRECKPVLGMTWGLCMAHILWY